MNDFLKRLRENPLYISALASVDDKQAKKIIAITEGFLKEAADGLLPLIEGVRSSDTTLVNTGSVTIENGDNSGNQHGKRRV